MEAILLLPLGSEQVKLEQDSGAVRTFLTEQHAVHADSRRQVDWWDCL